MASDETPLIAGRIHGIRVWSIEFRAGSASLEGVTGHAWAAAGEPTVARCSQTRAARARRHRAPAPNCGCGLYAVHPHAATTALDYLHGGSDLSAIAGIIEAWGRVEVHEQGFRAEFARPVAIALVGTPQDSDLGLTAARIARRYRAELIEVGKPDDLVPYCRERGLGLSKKVVGSLLAEAPAAVSQAPAASPTRSASSLLERIGDFLLAALLVVVGIVWYGGLALVAVLIAIEVINGDFFSSGEPFSERKLRVIDQALVRPGDEPRYVAIVRNTSEKRVALAAFARGEVQGGDRGHVFRLGPRGKTDWRPTLLPGETGVVIDELPGRRRRALPERLRFETELVARRKPARGTRPPVALGEPALDRARCLLTVAVEAGRAARESGITIVARDAAGEISAAGTVGLGHAAIERGRRVVELGEPGECPGWLRGVETYPFIFPSHAARAG